MKSPYLIFACLLIACNGNVKNTDSHGDDSPKTDTSRIAPAEEGTTNSSSAKTYENDRFRNVSIQKGNANEFIVEGEARVFEGTVSWVVEDGHNELMNGFETTDAGAPAWGHFKLTFEAKKQEPNSTLTLVLFESSAKDGSRVHELPIPLP